ncbi:MAG: Tyrosine recombinase XerD [Actinobacteria bacterium ADurb.Bin346]|nr:MAG: Tyrosine recombinase XerD [Actinobacteria bacterium ADurb.Bin346]
MENTNNKNIAFLKKQLEDFLSYKRAQGYKYKSEEESLGRFIKFLEGFGILKDKLSKDAVLEYCSKRAHETAKNHANRVSDLRQFAIYLNEKGYQAYIPAATKPSKHTSSFVPYIFTHDEILRIFKEVDRLKPNCRYNSATVYPVLFRMLYGCGLRISEALDLKVGDVDLVGGILTIKKSKYNKDRLVPMSESLNLICRIFYKKVHKNSCQNDYFFKNQNGSQRSNCTVYNRFRELLWKSAIPYRGRGKGPRLHDLRHVFCCHSLKEISDKKIDLYCALPVLSTYLGHSSIRATEKYLRLTEELYPDIVRQAENTTSYVYPEVYKDETN